MPDWACALFFIAVAYFLKNFEHDDSYFINLRVKCPNRKHRVGTSLWVKEATP